MSLLNFLRSGKYSDVTVVNRGQHFNVHRIILCLKSRNFDHLLSTRLIHASQPRIHLDIDPDIMELVFQHMYDGDIAIAKHKLILTLQATDMLQIDALKTVVEEQLFERCDTSDLPSTLSALLPLANTERIVSQFLIRLYYEIDTKRQPAKAKWFLSLESQFVRKYFTLHAAKLEPEERIMETLVQWYRHDPDARKFQICQLLSDCLRTADISKEDAKKLANNLRASGGPERDERDVFDFLADLPRTSMFLPQSRFQTGQHMNALVIFARSHSETMPNQYYARIVEDKGKYYVEVHHFEAGACAFPGACFLIEIGNEVVVGQPSDKVCYIIQGNISELTKREGRIWETPGEIFVASGAFSKKEHVVAVRNRRSLGFYLVSKVGQEFVGATKNHMAVDQEQHLRFASYREKIIMICIGEESSATVWEENLKKEASCNSHHAAANRRKLTNYTQESVHGTSPQRRVLHDQLGSRYFGRT